MILPDTERNQLNSCQTAGLDMFCKANRDSCLKYVQGVQRRLDRAVADGDKTKIRGYVRCLNKSRAVKILAIFRVCDENSGRHTAGIDGFAMPTDRKERRKLMESLIDEIDINKKPSPIRRAYIPKPNGDQRPLGIPTIMDRIIQEIIRISIEPICEYHFLPCSYGFRPKRSCQDAIQDLFTKLSQKTGRRWIVEGDIKSCFDHIDHRHILNTLFKWEIPKNIVRTIEKMLKAGIMENQRISPSEEGTPQGGIISPMLANVALTMLDERFKERFGYKRKKEVNPMVRYADDFVLLAKSEEQAEDMKSYVGNLLELEIGVKLSDEKTQITEITNGFDFLGFNIRKHKNGTVKKLLTIPSKANVEEVINNLRRTFDFAYEHGCRIDTLLNLVNPIIRGWANYYRHFVAKRAFRRISNKVWGMTARFIRRKYPNTIKSKWSELFFTSVNGDRWILHDRNTGATLIKMATIPITRYIKVRSVKRVYDSKATEYWDKREISKTRNKIYQAPIMEKLFKSQKGRCAYCKQIFDEDLSATHKHHLRPRSEGGDWKLGNLRLLHSECHTSLHSLFSRKDMSRYISNGIDYLKLLKPQ